MLRDQKGIYSVKVALLAERAVIEYDAKEWTVSKLTSVGTLLFLSPGRSQHISRKSRILDSMRHPYHPEETILCSCGYTA